MKPKLAPESQTERNRCLSLAEGTGRYITDLKNRANDTDRPGLQRAIIMMIGLIDDIEKGVLPLKEKPKNEELDEYAQELVA